MPSRDWSIEGRYIEYCSCDLGCPCESMAPPTQGYCTGAVGFKIDKGHCDGVSLDGLNVVATFYFPRAIHHGEGHMQPILDEPPPMPRRMRFSTSLAAPISGLGPCSRSSASS